MEIQKLSIHNFRSIKDATADLYGYTVFVGANNAGKSNILTALRIFYEHNIEFDANHDFPKFVTDDNESWIEIEYHLTESEFKTLKKEYQASDHTLKVRKYLKSEDKEKVKSKQSNIYAYENGVLSQNLFYGAKNISQAKLGSIIFIPEVSKTDDTLKLSGPSPLRDIIKFVMKKVTKSSTSFTNLNKAFSDFNQNVRQESSQDGFSLNTLSDQINKELKEWGVEFNLTINPISIDDMVKSLFSHSLREINLDREVEVGNFGQGFQRHLIYTLIKLSAMYAEKDSKSNKEFAPDFTIILFEEPEAFLHPQQQELLNLSLKTLSIQHCQQILITTHSPIFVSKNIEDVPSLIKIRKEIGITNSFQITKHRIQSIIAENSSITEFLREKLKDPVISASIKTEIEKKLGDVQQVIRLEEESIRYLLWLDSERSMAFFADHVLICEGATEKALIDYLIRTEWAELRTKKIYVLDAIGKFNIHRYMNLFNGLGIHHSVLADKDRNKDYQKIINEFIDQQKNGFTKQIDYFDVDIETFLGISPPPPNRKDKKPLNAMWHYHQKKIAKEKIDELKSKVELLVNGNGR